MRGICEHVLESFTNVDSKLLRSFRYLIFRPGQLTVAYMQGRRQPFLRPVPLFLIVNVLFFAVESLTGGMIFTTPLDSHLHTQPWSEMVPSLVAGRLEALHTTLALYSPVFDHAVALKARSLIILMALAFALFPMLLFARRRFPVAVHIVFSAHFYAFLLMLLCIATAVPPAIALMGHAVVPPAVDYAVSLSLLVFSAIYLFFAIRAVYDVRGVARVLSTLVLTVGVGAIVLGYRFFLLIVTLYTA
jgi:hypothetical protein